MLDLSGKKIMVTGASSGIGRATAILISKLGGTVIACGRDENRLDETISKCDGKSHMKMIFDVRETDSYRDIFDRVVADGKKLDGLVYSAGIGKPTPIRALDLSVVRETLEVNLISFMAMVAVYGKRKYNNGGSIVTVSSVCAYYPHRGDCAYIAAKGAIESLVKVFALELSDKKIRVNSIAPGMTRTNLIADGFSNSEKLYDQHTIFGYANPEDIANSIVFLLSDMSRYTTGRTLFADGGYLGQIPFLKDS